MTSRETILAAIRRNRPHEVPLPALPAAAAPAADLPASFQAAATAGGSQVVVVGAEGLGAALAARYPGGAVPATEGLLSGAEVLPEVSEPHRLAGLEVLVCRGALGVAENGAVWLPEGEMGHRAAPFLAQHLALVLDARAVVADMHAAYARLHVGAEGFGVFVAGPSKTADIEQILVIGAHGPRSLTVFLV